jgi:hypothetical protein
MAAGTWKLSAQTVDARGALSETTPAYNVQVSGWFGDLFSRVVDWGIIGLVVLLLLGVIVFLALNIVHKIRKWRIHSNRDVIELENRLRADIKKIEAELDRDKRAKLKGDE